MTGSHRAAPYPSRATLQAPSASRRDPVRRPPITVSRGDSNGFLGQTANRTSQNRKQNTFISYQDRTYPDAPDVSASGFPSDNTTGYIEESRGDIDSSGTGETSYLGRRRAISARLLTPATGSSANDENATDPVGDQSVEPHGSGDGHEVLRGITEINQPGNNPYCYRKSANAKRWPCSPHFKLPILL